MNPSEQTFSPSPASPVSVDRNRAIMVARVIARAPNYDEDSDIKLLARAFLREAGLS